MGALVGMGAILLCSTLWWEYQRVAVFSGRRIPIATRAELAEGQASWGFRHFADRRVVLQIKAVPGEPWSPLLASALEHPEGLLLNATMLKHWAEALAARGKAGDVDRARYLAQRVREWEGESNSSWFKACEQPKVLTESLIDAPADTSTRALTSQLKPFQCEGPAQNWNWRSFLERA